MGCFDPSLLCVSILIIKILKNKNKNKNLLDWDVLTGWAIAVEGRHWHRYVEWYSDDNDDPADDDIHNDDVWRRILKIMTRRV